MYNSFKTNLKKLEEYASSYDSYSELEKLALTREITDLFKGVINRTNFTRGYIRYDDKDMIDKIYNMIIKLESLSALVDFNAILLNFNCEAAVNEVIDLALKKLNLFITMGLQNQLQVKRFNAAKPFRFNNKVLDGIGNGYVYEVIKLVEFFAWILKFNKKIEVDVVKILYSRLTTEQLAFIHCQINYHYPSCDYDCEDYSSGMSEDDDFLALDKIFDVVRERTDLDKSIFMEITSRLGYYYLNNGFIEMAESLLCTKSCEEVMHILSYVFSIRLEGDNRDVNEDIRSTIKNAKILKWIRLDDREYNRKRTSMLEFENNYYHYLKLYGDKNRY